MNKSAFNLFLWHTKKSAAYIGLWGIIAVVLSVVSTYLYWHHLSEYQTEVARLRQQVLIAKNTHSTHLRHQTNAIGDAHTKAAEMLRTLPTLDALPALLKEINLQANAQHLSLEEGNYQFKKVTGSAQTQTTAISQYEMTLPIKGDYKQVRNFISKILYDNPMLALSTLKLRRESASLSAIEADLIFVIFVRE